MFLAEALLLRSEFNKRQSELRARTRRCLVVQEGESPPEDPNELLERTFRESVELSRLVAAINHVNTSNYLETTHGRMTVTQALARKDFLENSVQFLRSISNDTMTTDRYSLTEIRKVTAVSPAKLHSDADDVARELRQLTMALHRADWELTMGEYEPPEGT